MLRQAELQGGLRHDGMNTFVTNQYVWLSCFRTGRHRSHHRRPSRCPRTPPRPPRWNPSRRRRRQSYPPQTRSGWLAAAAAAGSSCQSSCGSSLPDAESLPAARTGHRVSHGTRATARLPAPHRCQLDSGLQAAAGPRLSHSEVPTANHFAGNRAATGVTHAGIEARTGPALQRPSQLRHQRQRQHRGSHRPPAYRFRQRAPAQRTGVLV